MASKVISTSLPCLRLNFDDEKKLIFLEIDVDEGKQFYVRPIESRATPPPANKGNPPRNALEEGNIYNPALWELSLPAPNQLGYFDQLKARRPQHHRPQTGNEKDGLVDLSLKVHEKGKNSIGLTAASADWKAPSSASIIQPTNFLGLGETLSVQASGENLAPQRAFRIYSSLILFDRPLQFWL